MLGHQLLKQMVAQHPISRMMGGEPSFVLYVSDQAAPSLYVCSPADLSSPWTPTEFSPSFPCTPGAHLYCVWRGPAATAQAVKKGHGPWHGWGHLQAPQRLAGRRAGREQTVQRHPRGLLENGLTGGETPALLKSVSALPALPSGTHRMLFVCLFGCFVCLFVCFLMQLRKGVYETRWVVCALTSNPPCLLPAQLWLQLFT